MQPELEAVSPPLRFVPPKVNDDAMLQHGMSIAREIADGMLRNGRTRRDCVDGSFR